MARMRTVCEIREKKSKKRTGSLAHMTKQLRWGHRIGNKISIAVNKKKESIKVSGNQGELDVMAWANRVDQIGVS